MTADFDSHVFNVLIQFYMDKNSSTVYSGNYTVWLLVNNYHDVNMYLMLKSNSQVREITRRAREEAEAIKQTPLYKALQEE